MVNPAPELVRIKYYNVIWMTKRAYLIATLIAAVVAFGAWGVAIALGFLPPLNWPWEQPARFPGHTGFAVWFYDHINWILCALVVAELFDIAITLRKFQQKEAEQRARLAKVSQTPTS